MKGVQRSVVGAALVLVWGATGLLPGEVGFGVGPAAAEEARRTAPYRQTYFNYVHQVPPDYVYRTSRLFIPAPGKEAARDGRSAADGAAPPEGSLFQSRIRGLAAELLRNTREEIADEYVIAVSTFVNLNRLYATSSFGRYLAEQLLTEMPLLGLNAIEVRKTPALMISDGHGEYSLSRDMEMLSAVQPVQAILVGTYTVAGSEVLVNARLLRNEDGMLLSSASLAMEMEPAVGRLLADESMPATTAVTGAVRLRSLGD